MQFYDYYSYEPEYKMADDDFKLVGHRTYYEFLQMLDRNEVKIENLNLRMWVKIELFNFYFLKTKLKFDTCCSLQRLQIVDLITRHGTFERNNFSIPTDNFLNVANEFGKFFGSLHTRQTSIRWIEKGAVLSEVMTEHGLCYVFNLAMSEEIYNTNLVQADLFHEYFSDNRSDVAIVPRRISTDTVLYGYYQSTQDNYNKIFNKIHDGQTIYIHDPYELVTVSSYAIKNNKHGSLYVLLEPKLYSIDESLMDLDPIEYAL